MNYNRGKQFTVDNLSKVLELLPKDVKIRIMIGDESEEAHYILNVNGELVIANDCYMQDADSTNLDTMLSFIKTD